MTASQHTENYQLPIYEPDDVPQYLGTEDSWNSTMKKLDSAIAEAAQTGGGGGGGGTPINVVQTAGQSTEDVMSQKAVTDQLTTMNTNIRSNTTKITANTDAISNKQNKLVFEGEGQNIKTINGEPLNGAGDISVSAGGGGGTNLQVFRGTASGTSGGEVRPVTATLQPGSYLLYGTINAVSANAFQMWFESPLWESSGVNKQFGTAVAARSGYNSANNTCVAYVKVVEQTTVTLVESGINALGVQGIIMAVPFTE